VGILTQLKMEKHSDYPAFISRSITLRSAALIRV
jgi:hypothetical protein